MVSFKDVHHICIGFDQHADVMFNRAIIRNDFDNSNDLWLTLVYNGDLDRVPSGAGENTFIKIEDNRGYGYGALDAINKGLDFASAGYRDIVILTNFDGYFFSEEKYKVLLNEFIESGKPFCAGLHTQYKVPLTDLMLFKRDFLKELLPIKDEVAPTRKEMEFLKEQYEGTLLGFDNVEEWVFSALHELGDPDKLWHKMQRDDLGPDEHRYRYTDKYGFGHFHWLEERFWESAGTEAGKSKSESESLNSIKTYMSKHNNSAGGAVEKYLQSAGWMAYEERMHKAMHHLLKEEMKKDV